MGAQAVRLSNVDIDNALKNKDFEVLFQPIFDLGNGALARVETFIRWRHPSLGVLPPGAFISFFETQGRMSELTRYVLGEALAAYLDWRGPCAPGFSINLALSDLSDESFASHFTRLLRQKNFPAELVTLECPMPPVDADVAAVGRQLERLAGTGARLAIEVRGRANEFLNSVEPFPFAEIKTGGAAILRFARTVRGPGLGAISELIEFANAQKAAITAVGVEDQASLSALRGLGFAAAQGNHLGKVGTLNQFLPSHVNVVRGLLNLDPLSADDLNALFRTGAPQLKPNEASAEEEPEAPVLEAAEEQQPVQEAKPKRPPTPAEGNDDLVDRLAARIAESGIAEGEGARSKAAALARARRKKLAARNALRAKAERMEAQTAPRDLQDRLSREFEAFSDQEEPALEEMSVGDEAIEHMAADEFEIDSNLEAAPTDDEAIAADVSDDEAPAAEENDEPKTAQARSDAGKDKNADSGEAQVSAPLRQTLGGVKGSAHFAPVIRVTQPEPAYAPQQDAGAHRGDLFEEPIIDAVFDDDAAPKAKIESEESAPAELEIPTSAANEDWVEETVAMAQTLRRKPAPKKSFLTRTVIPYSALKITHFWPRLKKKNARHAGGRVHARIGKIVS